MAGDSLRQIADHQPDLAYLGADLYEMATSWKFKLFYPFRRVAQQKSYRFGQQEAIWIICGEICVQDQNRII
nr:TDP-N-acetylfucosamine:lipid II N-acetylfucosaminyltransferase [Mannheimia haemolytica]